MFRILDRLYVGDLHYSQKDLIANNISYVINLCGQKTGMEHVHAHLADNGTNSEVVMKEIVKTVMQNIWVGNRVLVHCREGRSRSCYIAALYLERIGYAWNDALDIVRECNPKMDIEGPLLNSHEQKFL